MTIPVVLDTSALDALARSDVDAIAPAEMVAVVTEDGGQVLIPEATLGVVRDRYAKDPFLMRELGELLTRRGVHVMALLPEQARFAAALATSMPDVDPGSAAAFVLTLDVDGELQTYEPETALIVLPGHMINDLGASGDGPSDAWPT